MRLTLLFILVCLFSSCTEGQKKDDYIIQSDDYVLVEFAAKLEEAEHAKLSQ